jgi:hypothetical protein
MSEDERIAVSWQTGQLHWLFHSHQRIAYEQYRAWEKLEPAKQAGQFARIFGIKAGKRYGKTTMRFGVRDEDCRRNPGRVYRYASAFQKNIEEIVEDVSRYWFETCPDELRPVYKLGSASRAAGYYYHNGSILKLVGLDKNPDGMRGRASDGDDVSEAGFVEQLRYAIKNVLYHQYQGRPWARMCLESSAPVEVEHDFEDVFYEDCKLRGAFFEATLEDNPRLSREEKDEFIRAAGGMEDPDCLREYFNIVQRDPRLYLVTEFDPDRHVREVPRPTHAHAYTVADPGMKDLTGIGFGYFDFERAMFVLEDEFAERGAGTNKLADVIKQKERELWGTEHRDIVAQREDVLAYLTGRSDELADKAPLKAVAGATLTGDGRLWRPPPGAFVYWDDATKQFRANPWQRWTDVDLRLAQDLGEDHGIEFSVTEKDGARAHLNRLKTAFRRDSIAIHPRCKKTIAQLKAARWNKKRTEWFRDIDGPHGHFDLVAMLVYLWRNVVTTANPFPPLVIDDKAANLAILPWHKEDRRGSNVQDLNTGKKWRNEDLPADGGGRKWR